MKETKNKVLSQPVKADEIEWRVQFIKKELFKGNVSVVPYINNRCVMDRFDEAFGWDGWSNEIKEIAGGYLCKVTVKIGDIEVSKVDGASKTDIEPEKGGISDAMKRCAVQFGLGRDLYRYPKVYIENTEQKIPSWAYDRLEDLTNYILENKGYPQKFVVIKKQK